jgi:hypothetical protein
MFENNPMFATTNTINDMEVTLVATFNIRWKDDDLRITWDIWGGVYTLPGSKRVFILAEDPNHLIKVDIFDHTSWRQEDPSYVEEDLWLESSGGELYLRCRTSERVLLLGGVD